MIVADTNLLAYFLVPGPQSRSAERVRAVHRVWAVPSLLPHELMNVLYQHVRRGVITRDEAIRAYKRGTSMVEISILPIDPVAILRLSEQTGCTTYDADFVWLAKELDSPLVTADKEIL